MIKYIFMALGIFGMVISLPMSGVERQIQFATGLMFVLLALAARIEELLKAK